MGTYSYSIAPTVSDRIRTTTPTGTKMDQNADGTAGENKASAGQNDSYSDPRPLGGVPFTGPFDSTTLPLMVTGSHIAAVQNYAAGTKTAGAGPGGIPAERSRTRPRTRFPAFSTRRW